MSVCGPRASAAAHKLPAFISSCRISKGNTNQTRDKSFRKVVLASLAGFTSLKGKERELCLKIAGLCSGGKIRSIIYHRYEGGLFIEVEVETRMDWAENHERFCEERRDILTKDFGDGIILRLCEGQYIA